MSNDKCKYCSLLASSSALECTICKELIHLNCLKRGSTPGSLCGDVFFKFTCAECSDNQTEIIIRDKITWFQVIILTLNELLMKSQCLARKGYFHWKTHICSYIDKNWNILFKKDVKQKKNWMGTIAGTLSSNSGLFFKSGIDKLGESGWWCLTHPELSPEIASKLNSELGQLKAQIKKENNEKDCESDAVILENLLVMHGYKSLPETSTTSSKIESIGEDCASFVDSLLADQSSLDSELFSSNLLHEWNSFNLDPFENNYEEEENKIWMSTSQKSNEIIIPKVNETCIKTKIEHTDVNTSSVSYPKSLFNKSTCRKRPWETEECFRDVLRTDVGVPMLPKEEEKYLNKLTRVENISTDLVRLRAKLRLRARKRANRIEVFDIDNLMRNGSQILRNNVTKENCLDKFHVLLASSILDYQNVSFTNRITGGIKPQPQISPYTKRSLPPYIRRDFSSKPLWLRLMLELTTKTKQPAAAIAPIDYCYVALHLIPAINHLCQLHFWPGIDMTEALQYPDFSCIALYKKLVVGFAFLVPDVGHNEAYISFIFTRPEWRRAGIGTFMLYHLIQTCMGRDITLHVSATNSAVILYQQFGFKVEEFVQNFYDKYLPSTDTNQCRHALFLRLSR